MAYYKGITNGISKETALCFLFFGHRRPSAIVASSIAASGLGFGSG